MSWKVSILYKTKSGTNASVFSEPTKEKATRWLRKVDGSLDIVELEIHAPNGRLHARVRGQGSPF